MDENKQKIMTIDAKTLFYFFPKEAGEEEKPFCFNTTRRTIFTAVVKEEMMLEECPLLQQFMEVLKGSKSKNESTLGGDCVDEHDKEKLLYDKLVILDFGDIFLPNEKDIFGMVESRKEMQRNNVEDLMKNGLDLCFDGYTVHMMPFDKSSNMSRNSRMTFINDIYVKQMNKRLNLGIDFTKIHVSLSKYYAYRGLYLSTSRRVQHENFQITPETLVIIKDRRMKKDTNKPVNGVEYERNIPLETAVAGENPGEWCFQEPEIKELAYVDIPYDGEGIITPAYSEYINDTLQMTGATSYQVRLPFAKGMLHKVDVIGFLNDEDFSGGIKEDKYWYEDAFGIERDLKKVSILLTESMFKGKKWLIEYCKNNDIKDPMEYYCEALKKYNHSLYVSGTNLPYGHSRYTHLSYQAINTLAFNEEQFERVLTGHGNFIENPIEFLRGWDETEKESDDDKEDSELTYYLQNWKRAILTNALLANDIYIKEQLNNIQKGLLTKLATGKIVVEGQTRYLCRDLLPLLASLLKDEKDIRKFYKRYLFERFYMPFGKDTNSLERIKLDYSTYYAFFRNPHLSRNEQCLMQPLVQTSKEDYDGVGKIYVKYMKHLKHYHKYFGHLTGIVMVPRGSVLPLCLGGADFDGDLVSVIFNQDVVDAVKKGAYYKEEGSNWWKRKISVIKIPSTEAEEEPVPSYVPYQHVLNTFSNRIGQISNAAIAIGQIEYSRKAQSETEYDVNKPTCAKCTLLTGLEIDAAKNGIHPNLDLIISNENLKSFYLIFLRKFKKLKSEKNFRYENMSIQKAKTQIDEQEMECVEVSVKDCKTKAFWFPDVEQEGTYINQLPKYFFQYYKENNKEKKQKKEADASLFKHKSALSKNEKDVIKEFKKACDSIINLHFFYKNIFLKSLSKEKNKGFYAVENTEVLIELTYDEKQAKEIIFSTIPILGRKIESIITVDSSIDDIRNRINNLQWQFQPRDKRRDALEKILGNGFKESMLTEDEKKLLCHFNQQGYKLLWLLMDLIEGPNTPTYVDMYNRIEETRKEYSSEELKILEYALELEMIQYYENNALNIEQTIYSHCLRELKNTIGIYSLSLDVPTMIVALYEETKSGTNRRRFFWDAFSWEEIKALIDGKEAEDLC